MHLDAKQLDVLPCPSSLPPSPTEQARNERASATNNQQPQLTACSLQPRWMEMLVGVRLDGTLAPVLVCPVQQLGGTPLSTARTRARGEAAMRSEHANTTTPPSPHHSTLHTKTKRPAKSFVPAGMGMAAVELRLALVLSLTSPTLQLAVAAAAPRQADRWRPSVHACAARAACGQRATRAGRSRAPVASLAVERLCEAGSLSARVEEAVCTVYGSPAPAQCARIAALLRPSLHVLMICGLPSPPAALAPLPLQRRPNTPVPCPRPAGAEKTSRVRASLAALAAGKTHRQV